MYNLIRQTYIYCLVILIFIVLIMKTLHTFLGDNLIGKKPKLFCHFETENDILPYIDEMDPSENSIFFHETSCRGSLTSRQACAIESAATLHPDKQIFVLFSAPLTHEQHLKKIYNFDNVNYARIYLNYTQDTAVDNFLHRVYNKSSFTSHVGDVMRFVTLSKWGGIYLDLDTVVMKPLDVFGKNWATKGDDDVFNIGAMAFGRNEVGSGIVKKVFEEMKRNYNPSVYEYGSMALTKAIKRFCNTTDIQQLNNTKCKDFKIYDSSLFYPVHPSDHLYYYKPGYLRYQHKDAFMHHTWEWFTHDVKIEKRSPYTILAKNYCPKTYELFIDDFGGEDNNYL